MIFFFNFKELFIFAENFTISGRLVIPYIQIDIMEDFNIFICIIMYKKININVYEEFLDIFG